MAASPGGSAGASSATGSGGASAFPSDGGMAAIADGSAAAAVSAIAARGADVFRFCTSTSTRWAISAEICRATMVIWASASRLTASRIGANTSVRSISTLFSCIRLSCISRICSSRAAMRSWAAIWSCTRTSRCSWASWSIT